MSLLRTALASLVFHWRIHVAVALGVAAATAVLTGALLVGDSVRGSLRALALDRLGKIDELLIVDRFFRAELASELTAEPRFREHFSAAVPAILFPSGSVEHVVTLDDGTQRRSRAAGVAVIGSMPEFWQLGDGEFARQTPPGAGQIVLNRPLAEQLGVAVGDRVILRLGKLEQVPADSPLGRKSGRVESLPELEITGILPVASLGRFSLQPMQTAPQNAYVSLATLQEGLDAAGKANAIFIAGKNPDSPPDEAASRELAAALTPRLADLGLSLKHVRRTIDRGGSESPVFDYFSMSTDRMMLDEATAREAERAFVALGAEPVLTYLANSIERIEADSATSEPRTTGEANKAVQHRGIPYSMITAIDPAAGGPLVDAEGEPLPPLAEDEIALTSWAAEDQHAKVGDRIRVTFFEPETTHGNEREASADFRVAAIVPLTEPVKGYTRRAPAVFEEPPTPANDPDLTPEVPGITDQASIANWDPPFPFDNDRMRDQDDLYWENHRTTPKAYISLAAGQKLWSSRFGGTTSLRIPAAEGVTVESLEAQLLAQLAEDGERLGMDFQPLKRQSLRAASGTTPFDVLFLLLSMFIIGAALMLIWLLLRLGIEQRASEVGTFLALGWRRGQVARLLLAEGVVIAAIGAAIGVAAGVGYAWLMLTGLRTWWIGAVSSPFLVLYVTPLSQAIGFAVGLGVSLVTIWLGVRSLRSVPVRRLMAGETADRLAATRSSSRIGRLMQAILLVAAVGLAILATQLGGEVQAVAFLGAGAAVLTALLLAIAGWLRQTGRSERGPLASSSLLVLAVRNAGRNVGRSVTTIALMATASFLIIAVSSFRLSPSSRGVGGFDLLAESSEPIVADLNDATARRELFADQASELDGTTIVALRSKPGDDASCRNLYKATQPRVLGVTPALVAHFDEPAATPFGWAASAAATPEETANPWHLLSKATTQDQPVPVVLDKNTAMYSLQLYGGIGQEFSFDYGGAPTTFRVVGLLDNSVLQGSLLVGEANFTRLFPETSGYRYFLIAAPADRQAAVATLLEDRLSDEGFDISDSRRVLADLLAVQNTYISTFQSLGAIGLLLGTFGMAAVQLRSVFERRKELALLRATGFRRARLGQMVLFENLLLLVGGLATGAAAALVTVLPHAVTSGVQLPVLDLTVMLAIVLVVGMAAGLVAVWATMRAPLVAALRGE
jgi:putative ABC transport system permease protein